MLFNFVLVLWWVILAVIVQLDMSGNVWAAPLAYPRLSLRFDCRQFRHDRHIDDGQHNVDKAKAFLGIAYVGGRGVLVLACRGRLSRLHHSLRCTSPYALRCLGFRQKLTIKSENHIVSGLSFYDSMWAAARYALP